MSTKKPNRMWEIIKSQYKIYQENLKKSELLKQNPNSQLNFEKNNTVDSIDDSDDDLAKQGFRELQRQMNPSLSPFKKKNKQIISPLELVHNKEKPNENKTESVIYKKVHIDVDDATDTSRNVTQEIEINSVSEGSIRDFKFDLGLSSISQDCELKSDEEDPKNLMTIGFNMQETIEVEEREPNPFEEKPLYTWPEQPGRRIIEKKVIPKKLPKKRKKKKKINPKKCINVEVKTKDRIPKPKSKNNKVDLNVLTKGFELMKKFPKALESVKYVTANKYKKGKNCENGEVGKESEKQEKKDKSNNTSLTDISSNKVKKNKKKPKKKIKVVKPRKIKKKVKRTKQIKKKKEKRFTVKMQNMYII
jgi:hypothetical protein